MIALMPVLLLWWWVIGHWTVAQPLRTVAYCQPCLCAGTWPQGGPAQRAFLEISWCIHQKFQEQFWLVVSTPLKNISQLGWLFPIYWKIPNFSKPPTRTNTPTYFSEIFIWLVVYLPLWKMMEFVSWDDDIPNWMESHWKNHVPNHQPVIDHMSTPSFLSKFGWFPNKTHT